MWNMLYNQNSMFYTGDGLIFKLPNKQKGTWYTPEVACYNCLSPVDPPSITSCLLGAEVHYKGKTEIASIDVNLCS